MKRIFSIIWLILLLTAMALPIAVQAQTVPEDVEVLFTSREETYTEEDDIVTTLKLQNNLPHPITNLHVEISVPEGYRLQEPGALPAGTRLEAGRGEAFSIILVRQGVAEERTDQLLLVAIIAGSILVAGLLGFLIYVLIRKKISHKAVVAMLLVMTLLFGFGALPVQAQTCDLHRDMVTRTLDVSVGDETLTLTAAVYYDSHPNAGDLQIDTSTLGYREDLDAFVVTGAFTGLSGTLSNAEQYSRIDLKIYSNDGRLLQSHSIPAAKSWFFPDMGLLPGMNRIELTATGPVVLTAKLNLYDIASLRYDYLDGSNVDTDEDGLFDLLENALGTDPGLWDTDSDGLSDNEELRRTQTDPLNADTDGNGTADGDEDPDGDRLSNIQELKLQLSPILTDTDRDGLSDYDEQKRYGTDPVNPDTDGDGAPDGWEADHKFKPTSPNKTFSLSASTDGVSSHNPVSATVSMKVDGTQADVTSLSIDQIGLWDNPYLSGCVAGYLGSAVDISIDGTFSSATLTFRYDTSLGKVGKGFQPRIYHLNELTGEFEELENQTVKNGTVTAQTTHFSVYVLLNKVALSYALETGYEIVKTYYENLTGTKDALASLATADIAIVMDGSASMAWNDPEGKCSEVAHYFVEHMRSGYDRIALLQYTRTAQKIQSLTADQALLHSVLDSLTLDNGVSSNSGTNGIAALNAAMDTLEQGTGSYRYILFFSDGDDAQLANGCKEVLARALENRIQLICVSVGTGTNEALEALAVGSGGKFYAINDTVSVPEVFSDALSLFSAITPTDTDSNGDGITDFVTKLIMEGKLPLSNGSLELFGVDFTYDAEGNPSDDWDHDSLKNGQEIQLTVKEGQAYLRMISHPCRIDTDLDGFSDALEVQKDMNPLRYSVQREPLDLLMDTEFYYMSIGAKHDPDAQPEDMAIFADIENFTLNLDGLLFAGGMMERKEIYWELMTKYFTEQASEARLEDAQVEELQRQTLSWLDTLLSTAPSEYILKTEEDISKLGSPYNYTKTIHQEAWKLSNPEVEAKDVIQRLHNEDFLKDMNKFVSSMGNSKILQHDKLKFVRDLVNKMGKYTDKVTELGDKLDDFGKAVEYGTMALDVVQTIETFSKINADTFLFQSNLELLEYIAAHSKDECAVYAAETLLTQLSENYMAKYGTLLVDLVRDGIQIGWKVLVKFAETLPVIGTIVAAAEVVLSIADLVGGISNEVKATYQVLCHYELSKAHAALIKRSFSRARSDADYLVKPDETEDLNFFVSSFVRLRKLGEQHFVEYYKASCGIFAIFAKKEVERKVSTHVTMIESLGRNLEEPRFFNGNIHGGGGRDRVPTQ